MWESFNIRWSYHKTWLFIFWFTVYKSETECSCTSNVSVYCRRHWVVLRWLRHVYASLRRQNHSPVLLLTRRAATRRVQLWPNSITPTSSARSRLRPGFEQKKSRRAGLRLFSAQNLVKPDCKPGRSNGIWALSIQLAWLRTASIAYQSINQSSERLSSL